MGLHDAIRFQQVEDEGKWFPIVQDISGKSVVMGEVLVAFVRKEDFRRKLRHLEKRWRIDNNWGQKKEIPTEAWEDLLRKAAVGTIFKGIRGGIVQFTEAEREETAKLGFQLEPGSLEIPWTEHNGFLFLRAVRLVFETVMNRADERDSFHEEFVADAEAS